MENDDNVVRGAPSGAGAGAGGGATADETKQCGADHDVLPFDTIIVITQNESVAAGYRLLYPRVEFVARDWSAGTAWWDMCTAPVTSNWFMMVTSYFTIAPDFKLPVDVDPLTFGIKPIAPYIRHDSVYCNRDCKAQVKRARYMLSAHDRHFIQQYAVFNRRISIDYCTVLVFRHKRGTRGCH
jgi:hypothetical protein